MNWMGRIKVGVAIFAEAIGAMFLTVTGYYTILYFLKASNPSRHEYILGASLGLLYATGALLLATVLAGTVRASLSRNAFRWLAWPGLAIGALFLRRRVTSGPGKPGCFLWPRRLVKR